MKDIRDFILESANNVKKLYDIIFPLIELEPASEYDIEPDDEYWYDEKKAYKIVKDFLKDATSLEILTDQIDDEYFDAVKKNIEKNKDIVSIKSDDSFKKDKVFSALPKGADWQAIDKYSLKVDGNKLYLSPYTDSPGGVDWDVCVCIIKA